MTEPTPPRRRRRWFSLSLRTLMILILIVGGLMGWKARRASLQRRAVARIEHLRGSVVYDWQPHYPLFTLTSTAEPPGPVWLRKILGDEYFQEVVEATLSDVMRRELLEPPPPDALPNGPEWQAVHEENRRKKEIEQAAANDQLDCLEGLDRLETLNLDGEALKPEGLVRLGRLTSLKVLTNLNPMTDEGLAQLAKLTDLESLTTRFNLADDSVLALLERLPRLKDLSIHEGSPVISFSPDLGGQETPIIQDKITDAWLAHVGRLHQLKNLTLFGSGISDAGLAHLKDLDQLETLLVGGGPGSKKSRLITDAGLAHLTRLRSLTTLSLDSTEITDSGLAQLVGLENLQRLSLNSASKVTDAGVAHLEKMPQLSSLDMNAQSLTDAGLSRFQSMTKLKGLSLTGRKIKGEILDSIQAAIPGIMIRAERINDQAIAETGTQPSAPTAPPTPIGASPFDAITPLPAVPRN
jgi:hypothetical protein